MPYYMDKEKKNRKNSSSYHNSPASGLAKKDMGANFDGSSVPQPVNNGRKTKSSSKPFSQSPGHTQPTHAPKMFGTAKQFTKGKIGGTESPRSGY